MKTFKLLTDSCSNLSKEMIERLNIGVIPLNYIKDGEVYANKIDELKQFYDEMRNKVVFKTAALNENDFYNFFKKFLSAKEDILYIGFGSGLSSSVNNAFLAKDRLEKEFPERKIYIIDTLCACLGQGLLLFYADEKRKEGKSIEEIYNYIEDLKLKIAHYFTVDDLAYLYRGGRLSKTSFLIGNALRLKPILHLNNNGKMEALNKCIGKKKALNEMVLRFIKNSVDISNQIVGIAHGDDLEGALYVKKLLLDNCSPKEVVISDIDQTIGAHSGPGTIALFGIVKKKR